MSAKKKWATLFLALGIAIFAGFLKYQFDEKTAIPEVSLTLLSQQKLNLKTLVGKPFIIYFWSPTCPSCLEEMPKFTALYHKFSAQQLEIIAIAMAYDNPTYVINYAQKNHLPFKVAIDTTGHVARVFGDVRMTPMSFVYSAKGRLEKQFLGPPNWPELDRWLAALAHKKDSKTKANS